LLAGGQSRAEVPPYVIAPTPAEGRVHGDASLFAATDQGIAVTWDSSRTNSYFYFPLGVTFTRADRFTASFELRLDEIAIGVTPGKPYTFQVAAGLIGMESA